MAKFVTPAATSASDQRRRQRQAVSSKARSSSVDGDRAWINLGAAAGLKVGDKFNVFNVGEALIDPDTGAKLGADEKQTGSGAVRRSAGAVRDHRAHRQQAKAKDTVRKQ